MHAARPPFCLFQLAYEQASLGRNRPRNFTKFKMLSFCSLMLAVDKAVDPGGDENLV